MAQTWENLLFAHWPIAPDLIRPLIPPALELQTWNGTAWIGVVPFGMTGIHARGFPPLPWLSRFLELNVRTYVTAEGKPGVFFLSLDAANPVAVAMARRWFHLPYFRARMSGEVGQEWVRYRSRRTHRGAPPAQFAATYRPRGPAYATTPGTLAHWLTERYSLYSVDAENRLYRGEIHHLPWPLQRAEAEIETNSMALSHSIVLPDEPPLLHFAKRPEVAVWPLHLVL